MTDVSLIRYLKLSSFPLFGGARQSVLGGNVCRGPDVSTCALGHKTSAVERGEMNIFLVGS